MAGRNGGQQHFFGVPAARIATEGRVGGTVQVGLTLGGNGKVAQISGVGRSAFAEIARPCCRSAVGVFFAHFDIPFNYLLLAAIKTVSALKYRL